MRDRCRIRARAAFCAGTLALLVGAARASAQSAPSADGAEAERLWQEGKSLLAEHKTREACAALAQSDKLAPSVGTLGLLAACHEELGAVVTAYREYIETAQRARDARDPRAEYARARAEQLKKELPTLTIRLRTDQKDLAVSCDGASIRVREPLLLDPGKHALEASAPGKKPWQTEITIAAKESQVLDVPPLESLATPPLVGRPALDRAPPPRPTASHRPWAFAAGGLGVAGIVVSAITGSVVLAKRATIADNCDGPACNSTGFDAANDAHAFGLVSTVAFATGLAALGVSVLLFATDPGGRPRRGSVARAIAASAAHRDSSPSGIR